MLERAGRLRLPDTGYLHVYRKARQVDPAGRITRSVDVFAFKVALKFMLQICADGFSVSNAENCRLRMCVFNLREQFSLFEKQCDG